ncbi:MAG: hypothetical protein UHM85_05730 [Acutalibacteraceae bacterium]|nr:hypothetical protein [Acutalibacteraceae bacterium]
MGKYYIFKRYKAFLGKLAFRNGCTKSVLLVTFVTSDKSNAKRSVDD